MHVRTILARIKRRILKKPYLKNKQYPAYWFHRVVGKRAAVIVQIGSNDGKTGDPIYQLFQKNKDWEGLFVEPVPYLFEKLRNNYRQATRCAFENVVINEGDALPFYWVDPSASKELATLPYWYDQLGSFDKSHILRNLGDQILPFVRSSLLEGIRLQELFDRNGIEKIDILHIDTEGSDWAILKQLDLARYVPTFILYEVNHLSDLDIKSSYTHLSHHYHLYDVGIDVLAVSKNLPKTELKEMDKYLKKVTDSSTNQ